MAVTHTTPLATTRPAAPAERGANRPDGARFEAPLHTVPYPVQAIRDVCIETRDLLADEDDLRF